MTLTRVAIEQVLVKRCGKKMAVAGMSITTDGANDDLTDPIFSALMDMGYQPYNLSELTNDDLSAISEERLGELLDRAELRTLENIAGNIDLVDLSVGPRDENLSDLFDQVEKLIDRLITRISRLYGEAISSSSDSPLSISGGALSLDFQAKDE